VVKCLRAHWPCHGPGFSFQHHHGGSQPPVASDPGGSSSGLPCTWHTYKHLQKHFFFWFFFSELGTERNILMCKKITLKMLYVCNAKGKKQTFLVGYFGFFPMDVCQVLMSLSHI